MNRLSRTYLLITAFITQSILLHATVTAITYAPKGLPHYGSRSQQARRMAMDRRIGLLEARLRNIESTPIPLAEFEKIGKQLTALELAYNLPSFDPRMLMGPLERAHYEKQEIRRITQELAEQFEQQRKEYLQKLAELKSEFNRKKLAYVTRTHPRKERRRSRVKAYKTAKENRAVVKRRRRS